MLIGSHVSMSGKKMLEGSAEEAHRFGESTFMIYTGAPQNTRRKSINDLNIEKGHKVMEQYGLSNIVVHAPYIINIGNTTKPEVYELGVNFLQNEIERTQAIGAKDIVLHPGAHVGAGADKGINQIIKGLNEVLTHDHDVPHYSRHQNQYIQIQYFRVGLYVHLVHFYYHLHEQL